MIDIYRSNDGERDMMNEFHACHNVREEEITIKTKTVFGEVYTYAEPKKEGSWAFGGNILFTSNGIHPKFNTPIKLHDRNMRLEGKSYAERMQIIEK